MTVNMPSKLYEMLDAEALRRLKEQNLIGKKTTPPIIRDIICICVGEALAKIVRLTKEEFVDATRRAKA